MDRAGQAEATIWESLFEQNSPLSEATRRILTDLQQLGLDTSGMDLHLFREYFREQNQIGQPSAGFGSRGRSVLTLLPTCDCRL